MRLVTMTDGRRRQCERLIQHRRRTGRRCRPTIDARSCCEVEACSWVQPSGQQMPSIAFRDANKVSIAAARSLLTHRLCAGSWQPGFPDDFPQLNGQESKGSKPAAPANMKQSGERLEPCTLHGRGLESPLREETLDVR